MRKLFLGVILSVLIILPVHFGYAADDDSLVLYLPFDEGSGDTSEDQSMYGNDAAINIDWGDGHSGSAVAISGVADNFVVVEHSESLVMDGEITIMAWINPTGAWGGEIKTVLAKSNHNGGETTSYGLVLEAPGNQITLFLGTGGGRTDAKFPTALELDEWQHVAASYDGDTARGYVNGELLGETALGINFEGTNDFNITIGASENRANYSFSGNIDEVVVYNRALSDAEVEQVMENGLLAVSSKGKLATTWASIKN